MKHKTMILSLLPVIALVGLAGCKQASQTAPKTEVVLLVGSHANSAALQLDSPFVTETVQKSVKTGGSLSVVVDDGTPFTKSLSQGQDFLGELKQYKNDPSQQKMLVQSLATESLQKAEKLKAQTPEVNTLAALQKSVQLLQGGEAPNKVIVMDDTALSTTGVLDFRNHLLDLPPEKIVAALKAKGDLPDLTGVTVRWLQEPTASPQTTLSAKENQQLIAIWQAIVTTSGGKLELQSMVGASNIEKKVGKLPAVSTVMVSPDTPINYNPKAKVSFSHPLILSNQQVQFQGDSAAYVSRAAVMKLLSPIATSLKQHPEAHLLLAGTTAGDAGEVDEAASKVLSLQRAEAVKQSLVALGVKANQLTTVGCGINSPWHVAGAGLSGDKAEQNRSVVLLDASSETAKELTK